MHECCTLAQLPYSISAQAAETLGLTMGLGQGSQVEQSRLVVGSSQAISHDFVHVFADSCLRYCVEPA